MIIGRVLLMSTLRCVGALESFWQLLWSSLSCNWCVLFRGAPFNPSSL